MFNQLKKFTSVMFNIGNLFGTVLKLHYWYMYNVMYMYLPIEGP